MLKIQSALKLIKNPKFLLALVLVVFFLKGVFLATLFPIFTGQDESRHYNSIQHINEPQEKNWKMIEDKEKKEKDRLDTYNYSDEIRNTVNTVGINELRGEDFGKMSFSRNFDGKNEAEINSMSWLPINRYSPVDDAGLNDIYHRTTAHIEKALNSQNILVRFFSIRIFSVLVGILTILIFYLIFRNAGFFPKTSLLLTAIISFQPRFSIYYTNINYDVFLILFFSLFILAGVLILKNGLNWKNLLLLILSATLAYSTKKTALVLLAFIPFFLAYLFYKKYNQKFNFSKKTIFLSILLISIAILFLFSIYLPFDGRKPLDIITSFFKYSLETLTIGKFRQSAEGYWGIIGWTKAWFMNWVVYFIWAIEIAAAAGIMIQLFFKKKKSDFLPDKKFIIFFLAVTVSLQIGIRLADWYNYDVYGKVILGAPGRYFLPSIASHIALVSAGLGTILGKEKLKKTLAAGLVLMFSFYLYLIFNVIVYRYYL